VEEASTILEAVLERVDRINVPPLKETLTVLPADDPYVLATLRATTQAGGQESGWADKFQRLLDERGMMWRDCKPPDGHAESKHFLALTEREKACVAYAFQMDAQVTSVDVSQSLGRLPARSDNLFANFTTRSKIYMFHQKRVLTGREMLMLHGMPPQILPEGVGDPLLRDLAGNSFLAGAVIVILISTFLHVPPEVLVPTETEALPADDSAEDNGNDDDAFMQRLLNM
jgi:hypothetical protein